MYSATICVVRPITPERLLKEMKIPKFMTILIILVISLVAGLFMTRTERGPEPWHTNEVGAAHEITAYMSPTCGCCPIHTAYLKRQGYRVTTKLTDDMDEIKDRYGVPDELLSCHTTVVNDGEYFIEGHIPIEPIKKLLETEPDILGIGMPGMPSGSPGMPGVQEELFEIMQKHNDGSISQFMSV